MRVCVGRIPGEACKSALEQPIFLKEMSDDHSND
jgi:hypothetical protein